MYIIGSWGHNHQLLAVDVVEVTVYGSDEDSVLLGDTEVESLELIVEGKLNDE